MSGDATPTATFSRTLVSPLGSFHNNATTRRSIHYHTMTSTSVRFTVFFFMSMNLCEMLPVVQSLSKTGWRESDRGSVTQVRGPEASHILRSPRYRNPPGRMLYNRLMESLLSDRIVRN